MELGLFPLGIVLLPGEQIPLHVFEPRYRELIGECLETGEPFGLVLADDDGLRGVGTRATVVEVLDRLEDGRLNVVIEGGRRFRLRELTGGRSFQTGLVDDVEDEDDPAAPGEGERALELFHELRELVEAEVDDPEPSDWPLSYALAGRLEFDVLPKQELLELRSERMRVDRLIRLLETGVERVRLQRERAEHASKNGRFASPS